ncbi:hypothetical protein H310_02817 [Aphanomyces invadans]|uniref:Ubiquitin-like modifier-activating enzyme 5 n=1 Tax=Aphanomyces invadans TaxID=157072 RepID=A0A024UL62_9STRA|nr:hypothetical protein H310_02817 [Aphanomyces invadans]ETW06602.1 hypothetical protein H310_02817 [Aphanomyces invadans]|eukprot:XP_008864677.1 hypothetical protein H310_02817 [Aphanomyces invadans]
MEAAVAILKESADESTTGPPIVVKPPVVGEVPLLAQMQLAMDRLDNNMTTQPGPLLDVAVTRKQSCLLKDHVEPRPDFASVKFTLKNRFSHLASFRKKKIIENIEDLKQKCVAVIGLGGVGALVAEMFTRSGVGKLTLIDHGVVKMASMSRMHYLPEHVGMSKVQASRLYLRHLNPHVEIETFHCNVNDELDAEVLLDVLQDCKMHQTSTGPTDQIGLDHHSNPSHARASHGHMQFRLPMDAILCCVDNSAARGRVNQIALQLSIPLIDVRLSPCSSAITVQTIFPGYSACMQCHWSDKFEADAIVADAVSRECPATLPQCELMAAGLASQSAIKLLLEFGEQIPFYRVNCLDMDISTFWFKPNEECAEPMCKLKQSEYQLDVEKQVAAAELTGSSPTEIHDDSDGD